MASWSARTHRHRHLLLSSSASLSQSVLSQPVRRTHTHRYTHTQLRTDWGDELLVPDSDWNQLKVATTSGPQQTWVKIVTTCGSSSEEQRFVSTAISIFPDSNPLAVIPSFHSLSYFISLERSGEEDGLWMEQISRFLPPVVHYFANTFQTQLLSWR